MEFKKVSNNFSNDSNSCFSAKFPNGYKHSYWHGVGTEPMRHLTVGHLVDMAAERWTDREAFVSVYEGLRLTFGEAREQVCLSLINDTCNDGAAGGCDGPTCWTQLY